MDETNTTNWYDDHVQTRDVQILKSILPFLNRSNQRQTALLIQYLEFKQVNQMFNPKESTLAMCEIPEGTDRKTAILSAIRKYSTPKEQETIDTMLTLFSIMENMDIFTSI
jgi:hypothetical protein